MISIIEVDYLNQSHADDLITLMDEYASDPMGGGESLPVSVKEALPSRLARLDHAISLLAYVDDVAAGLLNAFEGFSTFAAMPLINIHDVIVSKEYRRQGISQRLIQYLEKLAKERGCCKLTLEVLAENSIAKSSYSKMNFESYKLSDHAGCAEFWHKKII